MKAFAPNENCTGKMMLLKCCTHYVSIFGNFFAVATGLEKVQTTIELGSFFHASKVMLKTFQARLQQYVNQELPEVKAGFQRGRATRDQIANVCWIMEKAREFQKKKSTSASLTTVKPLACRSQQTVENS